MARKYIPTFLAKSWSRANVMYTYLHYNLNYIHLAWSAPFLKTFENMRKLDYFRLPGPRCTSMAAGAGSLRKSNFLMFSKVLRKAPDQANTLLFLM